MNEPSVPEPLREALAGVIADLRNSFGLPGCAARIERALAAQQRAETPPEPTLAEVIDALNVFNPGHRDQIEDAEDERVVDFNNETRKLLLVQAVAWLISLGAVALDVYMWRP